MFRLNLPTDRGENVQPSTNVTPLPSASNRLNLSEQGEVQILQPSPDQPKWEPWEIHPEIQQKIEESRRESSFSAEKAVESLPPIQGKKKSGSLKKWFGPQELPGGGTITPDFQEGVPGVRIEYNFGNSWLHKLDIFGGGLLPIPQIETPGGTVPEQPGKGFIRIEGKK